MNRRLPVYVLVDASGSMRGEPIFAVNVGLEAMMSALRNDPFALETVHLSVIGFATEVTEVLPLTPVETAQIPEILPPRSGATHLGAALEFLIQRYDRDIQPSTRERKGDFSPMAFIMTDGKPSDLGLFEDMCVAIKQRHFAEIVGCAAGPKAREEYLKQVATQVVRLDTTDASAFAAFFKWVSNSITAGSRSGGLQAAGAGDLPPPPPEINVVL